MGQTPSVKQDIESTRTRATHCERNAPSNQHAPIPFKKGQLVVVTVDGGASLAGRLCESLTQKASAALD